MQHINFYYDLCALSIITVLLFSAFLKKSSSGRSNRIFIIDMTLLFCAVIVKLAFIASVTRFEYSPFVLSFAYISLDVYLFLKNLIFVFALLLLLSSIGIFKVLLSLKFFTFMIVFFALFPAGLAVFNVLTKKLFFITGALVLYETPLMLLYYVPLVFFILCGIFVLIYYRKSVPPVKIALAAIIFVINFILIAFNSTEVYKQIELFALTVCAFLIHIFTQRPELFINKTVNTKSGELFTIETRQTFLLGRKRSVIFVKITNFKNISVYIGQENYRGFLEYVSDILYSETYMNKSDFEIYYLRDAFFAIVSDSSDQKMIYQTACRVNETLLQSIVYSEFELHPEPSICIVRVPQDIKDLEFYEYFISNYHKIIGKTEAPVAVKDISSSRDFKIKSQIEAIITDAFEKQHFEVFFQPAWGVKEGRFVSAEALLRLKDPLYGFIPPSIFIPVAEENGLIYALGDFVLKEVCRFIAGEDFKELGLDFIEINLSKSQCIQKNLVDAFLENVNVHGVLPEQIRFEITEDSSDSASSLAESNIRTLHGLGVSFALDDYGTGYSNIKKVTGLPLKTVKLDKSFVDEMKDPVMWGVIQDTVHMLKALKMEVFVEGIEDEESAAAFEKLGADSISGYYWATPLPEEEFVQFIRHKNQLKRSKPLSDCSPPP